MIYVDKKRYGLKIISKITIDNEKGLKIVLSSMGAAIYKCYFNDVKITEAPDYKNFLHSYCYYGKTAGRTAGRIRNGVIYIDNKKYQLAKGKIHSLHGGEGFSFKNYRYQINEDENEILVKFTAISKDLDNGYPGLLVNQVLYHISKKSNEFEIEFKAKSKKDTICNLTNHTYWNLNGDRENILNHKIYIDADEYVKIDNELLKLSIEKVDDTFDYRNERELNKHLFDESIQSVAKGYDHDWILNKHDLSKPCLTIKGDKTNFKLEVYTTNPVCHIYTNNYAKKDEIYNSMAIEMQKRIFDVNEGKVDLKKNELYLEKTKYKFIKE